MCLSNQRLGTLVCILCNYLLELSRNEITLGLNVCAIETEKKTENYDIFKPATLIILVLSEAKER